MSASKRWLAEQAQRDAEATEAAEARLDRTLQDADRQLQLSRDRIAEDLKSGLMAAQSSTENAIAHARALRARRQSRSEQREEGQQS